jgi:hypothetical protein
LRFRDQKIGTWGESPFYHPKMTCNIRGRQKRAEASSGHSDQFEEARWADTPHRTRPTVSQIAEHIRRWLVANT